jgi:membrane protein implicated in regulation of membrane protease activity
VDEGFVFDAYGRKGGMADWMMWLAMAAIVVILEMFSGTFYLLMIGIGLLAGALAAAAGLGNPQQLMIAAVVGIAATFALRRSKWGRRHKIDSGRDPNVNLDIGQSVHVTRWISVAGQGATARAMYRGALWDIELMPGEIAQPGQFIILEMRGSRLIVTGKASDKP